MRSKVKSVHFLIVFLLEAEELLERSRFKGHGDSRVIGVIRVIRVIGVLQTSFPSAVFGVPGQMRPM